jgi:hypothetical protein
MTDLTLIPWDSLGIAAPLADAQELLVTQPIGGVKTQRRVTVAVMRAQLMKAGSRITLGSDGTISAASTIWWPSTGMPANAQGIDGDYDIDVLSGLLYQRRAGAWVGIGSLAGPPGAPGLNGVSGDIAMVTAADNAGVTQAGLTGRRA